MNNNGKCPLREIDGAPHLYRNGGNVCIFCKAPKDVVNAFVDYAEIDKRLAFQSDSSNSR